MRIEATPTLVRLWFKGDDVFKDVFNQHIVGAELTGETVLGGGGKTKGKGSNRPIRFSLPVLDLLWKVQRPLAGILGSPETLGAAKGGKPLFVPLGKGA